MSDTFPSIRQDPTTKEWVIVAPGRSARPHNHQRSAPSEAVTPVRSGRVSTCPFCPGNEAATPPELFRVPDTRNGGWRVRVIPNKFAALTPSGQVERREHGPLFREMSGVGHHEVIIDTPLHDRMMAHMSDGEVEAMLHAYQARYRALREDHRVRYILIFKNHGVEAGTSLEHPHSQLVATPVAPLHVRQKYDVAIAHYDDTGRCLYCDLLEAEVAAKRRVICERGGFVVFQPFASRAPFETWIMPRRHQGSFGHVSKDDLGALAHVVRATVRGLHDALDNPAFNLIVHSAPFEDEHKPYYLWHVQVLPRLSTLAGFELGSGIRITTVTPEASAEVLRAAMR